MNFTYYGMSASERADPVGSEPLCCVLTCTSHVHIACLSTAAPETTMSSVGETAEDCSPREGQHHLQSSDSLSEGVVRPELVEN